MNEILRALRLSAFRWRSQLIPEGNPAVTPTGPPEFSPN